METIEIKTTQNVVIEHELANVGTRVLAWIIDNVLMTLFFVVNFYLIIMFLTKDNKEYLYMLMVIYFVIIYISYNLVCELFFNGQTIGKRALNIRVIKLDRSRSDIQSLLIRSVFRMIDINLCLGTFAFIFITSSPRRQRLGDMLAHTAVVKTESHVNLELSDLLKIDTVEKYTPQFPQVRQLTDDDIITIRQVMERHRNHPNKGHHEALILLVKRLQNILEIESIKSTPDVFLKTLIKDYIVLTR